MNGKPFWLPASEVAALEQAIHAIGVQLIQTCITQEPVTQEQQPLAWGNTCLEKFACLRNHINLKHLLQDVVGWTEDKMKLHLNRKEKPKYYGVFTDEMLEKINSSIHWIAVELCNIKLEYQEPQSRLEAQDEPVAD